MYKKAVQTFDYHLLVDYPFSNTKWEFINELLALVNWNPVYLEPVFIY
jgi:hypothetical protein